MKKLTIIVAMVVVLALATVGVAFAVTNGQPDGDAHPYVGLAVFDIGGGPAWRCSASLLTPTVVLTAGHCTDGAEAARVWFDEVVQGNPEYPFSGATSYDGTAYTFPGFCIGCGGGLPGFAMGDVGIIVLSEAVPTSVVSEYAQLPAVGLVDGLSTGDAVDLVGYGVQEQIHGGGPPVWTGLKIRLYAPSRFISGNFVHSDNFLRLSANPGQDKGGTCFGDSGGGDYLGGTSTVLGVNSYVTNGNCKGVTYSARVDTPEVMSWIQGFLP